MALVDVRSARAATAGSAALAPGPSLLPVIIGAVTVAVALSAAFGWLAFSSAVLVESDPAEAQLYVNGVQAGRASRLFLGWGAPTWEVRVEAPGYLPWSGRVHLEPRGTTRIFARLVPLPGRLEIESAPSGAVVHLNDREIGVTPVAVGDLPPGRHRVTVAAPDHEPWFGQIDVQPGQTQVARIDLQPLPAHLTVLAAGGEGAVWVDDQFRGYAPLEIPLHAGEHLVRVEAEGFHTWERVLTLLPNEVRTVNLSLQQPWPDPERAPVQVLAVMIENQEQARPQSGLTQAGVVYEALAEGGITRFLALFIDREPEVVGPVRSARHYFVQLAREFGAPLVHIGASPLGYEALGALNVPSLDGIRGDPGFWRSPTRAAPHNLYTNLGAAKETLKQRRVTVAGSFGGLEFKRAAARLDGEPISYAMITYRPWGYTAEWHYDPYWNEYARFMDGHPHMDAASGEQIRATNVVIQEVESWPIPFDREGRLELALVGKGRYTALIDGTMREGIWSKSAPDAPTEYRDRTGAPLRLNRGPTWIQIVPPEAAVLLR